MAVDVNPASASEPFIALAPLQPPAAAQVVTLLVDQLRVELPPLPTVAGVATSVTDGGGGDDGEMMATLTDCVAVPPGPVQDSANDASAVNGPVETLPEVVFAPLQLPTAEHPVALVEDHVSVASPPGATFVGDTDSVTDGPGELVGDGATVAVTVCPATPPEPVQVKL